MRRWSSLLRQTTLVFVILATGLALVLFTVKHQVQDLEMELSGLEAQIAVERRATHVLGAEWSYLTEAERLRELSRRYLGLEPLTPEQIGSFGALSARSDKPADSEDLAGLTISEHSSEAAR